MISTAWRSSRDEAMDRIVCKFRLRVGLDAADEGENAFRFTPRNRSSGGLSPGRPDHEHVGQVPALVEEVVRLLGR